jgi:hypothetical protein
MDGLIDENSHRWKGSSGLLSEIPTLATGIACPICRANDRNESLKQIGAGLPLRGCARGHRFQCAILEEEGRNYFF